MFDGVHDAADSWGNVERAASAARAGWSAKAALRVGVLRAIAAALEARREEILTLAGAETALHDAELSPEFERMVGTLRMFAETICTHEWRRETHIPPATDGPNIGPNHDLRSMLVPLGDVVGVFGASNFPLAYGVCGGDTASALAAGCAVVVKEHPAHPKTGRLIARIARGAMASGGASEDLLGYIVNQDPADFSVAQALARHPSVCAVGFTGSTKGGLAIEKLARQRAELGLAPIPVFAEMGSSNVVIVTRDARAERGQDIADELAAALVSRCGQQCTNIGLILFDRPGASRAAISSDSFVDHFVRRVTAAASRRMLSPRIRDEYLSRLRDIASGAPLECTVARGATTPEQEAAGLVAPAVVRTDLAELCKPKYTDEIFGPACVVVHGDLDDPLTLSEVFAGRDEHRPWGALVASIYLGREVREADRRAVVWLSKIAGRVVFNGVPTGVRVSAAMVHGGPFPATNQPHSTAVGARAIERWCRPVCFQNAPPEVLPTELR